MAIDIGGDHITAVPQDLLNHFHRNPHHQQQGGSAVSQIVKADGRQTYFGQDFWEDFGEIARIKVAPVQIGEHQIAVFPG